MSACGRPLPLRSETACSNWRREARREASSPPPSGTRPPDRHRLDAHHRADLRGTSEVIHAGGGIVTSVCHGACALINLRDADGNPHVRIRTVTGFATVEEKLAGVKSRVPFLLEDELRAKGAEYVRSTVPMTPHAVRDGRLITGQNPVSTKAVSDLILAALAERASNKYGDLRRPARSTRPGSAPVLNQIELHP
ncbi:hypothetical protein ACWEBX_23950 [Streptomyces sp. NPDC005070]